MLKQTWLFLLKPKHVAALALIGAAIVGVWDRAASLFSPPDNGRSAANVSSTQTTTAIGNGAVINFGDNVQVGTATQSQSAGEKPTTAPLDKKAESGPLGASPINTKGDCSPIISGSTISNMDLEC